MKKLQSFDDPFTAFTLGKQEGTFFNTPITPEYLRLTEAFTHWLQLLNFEPSTLHTAPVKIQEFLSWLESHGITEIAVITRDTITTYFDYLKTRQNKSKGGRLSKNSLRTHLTNLRRFARYLRESEGETFEVSVQIKGSLYNVKDILTQREIKALYESAGNDLFGQRDRAMLAIYYGCGLRRSEGLNLDVSDVLLDRNLLYIRRGKNFKQRYVPMTEVVRDDIKNYIEGSRLMVIQRPTQALFLNQYGTRIKGQSMIYRLQQLKEKAGITKNVHLHTLRHSIATHLLQSGMELEKIKQFLGHSSLESTQIYTHIVHEPLR